MNTQRKKNTVDKSGRLTPDQLGKSSLKIHNMLDNVERTFLPVGSEIGKYRIIEEIDRGGMAVVYKALQLDLDRVVALKILPANITINRRFVERFLSEAHAVAKLSHPSIVSIYEVSMENNIYFLAMEYIPGKNLFHYLHQQKPKLVEVLEIFVKLADALGYAHEQRIVHRDLKLNNVIMRDRNTPVLIDFGLAKTLEEEEGGITKTGEIIGSPAYMAPERIVGDPTDSRGDICSLGIMLYEMLTFKNPYLDPRSIHQTTMNVIAADPVPPRKLVLWLPIEVEAITLKAMRKAPAERYQTMAELRDDIARYQRGEQVLANPPSTWSKVSHYLRKHWAAVSIAGTVLFFSLLFSVVLHLQSVKERSHWQLVLHETFDDTTSLSDWSFRRGTGPAAPPWEVRDSVLRVNTDDYTFIRLERPYTRDVKIEFEIIAREADLFNTGFFLCGSRPDSAYCFLLHTLGESGNGITFPGSRFLFSDLNPLEFPTANRYHAEVEKAEGEISFKLNGVTVARVHDHWPPLGKDHQNIGFFVDGSRVAFDDLKVYRRAMPLLTKPTIIADRLLQHGNVKSALEEYRELLLDISRRKMVRQIKLGITECLIRLGELEGAATMLADEDVTSGKEEGYQAYLLYLKGQLWKAEGDVEAADRLFLRLYNDFPNSPLGNSVVAGEVVRCIAVLDSGRPHQAEDRLAVLRSHYPRHASLLGQAHLAVLKYFARRRMSEEALEVGQRILKAYPGENDILARTRTTIGRIYLGKRKKHAAVDMFNQCIGTYHSSPGVWEAWMALGEVYAYDRNFIDALSVYRKVYTECPKSVPLPWMARIRMGETAHRSRSHEPQPRVFEHVARGRHPFPQVRLIAELYSGACEPDSFVGRWTRLHPGNRDHHYFLARRALMQDRKAEALRHLDALLASLPQDSWGYVRVFSLKNEIERL